MSLEVNPVAYQKYSCHVHISIVVHSYNTRSANKGNLQIPLTNLSAGNKAIAVSGAKVWNNIPNGIKQAQSLDIFKKELKEYLIKTQDTRHSWHSYSIVTVFEGSSTTSCAFSFFSHPLHHF